MAVETPVVAVQKLVAETSNLVRTKALFVCRRLTTMRWSSSVVVSDSAPKLS